MPHKLSSPSSKYFPPLLLQIFIWGYLVKILSILYSSDFNAFFKQLAQTELKRCIHTTQTVKSKLSTFSCFVVANIFLRSSCQISIYPIVWFHYIFQLSRSVPSKVFQLGMLGAILPNLTKLEGFLYQNH